MGPAGFCIPITIPYCGTWMCAVDWKLGKVPFLWTCHLATDSQESGRNSFKPTMALSWENPRARYSSAAPNISNWYKSVLSIRFCQVTAYWQSLPLHPMGHRKQPLVSPHDPRLIESTLCSVWKKLNLSTLFELRHFTCSKNLRLRKIDCFNDGFKIWKTTYIPRKETLDRRPLLHSAVSVSHPARMCDSPSQSWPWNDRPRWHNPPPPIQADLSNAILVSCSCCTKQSSISGVRSSTWMSRWLKWATYLRTMSPTAKAGATHSPVTMNFSALPSWEIQFWKYRNLEAKIHALWLRNGNFSWLTQAIIQHQKAKLTELYGRLFGLFWQILIMDLPFDSNNQRVQSLTFVPTTCG